MKKCSVQVMVPAGFVSALLSGCAATQNVVDPNAITLEQALVGTVDALSAAHEASIRNGRSFGFYGCSVTAVYNISATGTQNNKFSLTASGPPATVIPVVISGSAYSEATATGTRGNTVTVVFGTRFCLPNASAKPIKAVKKVGTTAGSADDGGPIFDAPLSRKR